MSMFLDTLLARSYGPLESVRPRPHALFEPMPDGPPPMLLEAPRAETLAAPAALQSAPNRAAPEPAAPARPPQAAPALPPIPSREPLRGLEGPAPAAATPPFGTGQGYIAAPVPHEHAGQPASQPPYAPPLPAQRDAARAGRQSARDLPPGPIAARPRTPSAQPVPELAPVPHAEPVPPPPQPAAPQLDGRSTPLAEPSARRDTRQPNSQDHAPELRGSARVGEQAGRAAAPLTPGDSPALALPPAQRQLAEASGAPAGQLEPRSQALQPAAPAARHEVPVATLATLPERVLRIEQVRALALTARPAPVPPLPPPATPAQPSIQVMIGRIEVRAAPPPPAPRRERRPSEGAGLDEYLRRRSQGGQP